ncbi:PREDICTED: uncharacterized protein LOC106820027, partial [Priapulus caudatus]|uniref:Uncharacterized protein LOC106820027 n=1 Tax=Priapulus caudatus TaxID=37621 RepID=A0ABM1F6J8_PRICU
MEVVEPVLPPPDSLSVQFSQRAVFVIEDADADRLTASFWLGSPAADDSDNELDMEPEEPDSSLSEKLCPGFTFEELEKRQAGLCLRRWALKEPNLSDGKDIKMKKGPGDRQAGRMLVRSGVGAGVSAMTTSARDRPQHQPPPSITSMMFGSINKRSPQSGVKNDRGMKM